MRVCEWRGFVSFTSHVYCEYKISRRQCSDVSLLYPSRFSGIFIISFICTHFIHLFSLFYIPLLLLPFNGIDYGASQASNSSMKKRTVFTTSFLNTENGSSQVQVAVGSPHFVRVHSGYRYSVYRVYNCININWKIELRWAHSSFHFILRFALDAAMQWKLFNRNYC